LKGYVRICYNCPVPPTGVAGGSGVNFSEEAPLPIFIAIATLQFYQQNNKHPASAILINNHHLLKTAECTANRRVTNVVVVHYRMHPLQHNTVYYGLRRSEILGLKWEAVDFEDKNFTVKNTVVQTASKIYHKASTKTKSSYRTLPMSNVIIEMFKRAKAEQSYNKSLQPNDYKDNDYIFTNVDGSLIRPNYVTKHFKDVLAKNNLPMMRLHDLRHSAASYLLYLGFSMKEIQMWLGHGDIGTTMNLYTHLDLAAKRNIAESLNEKFV